MIYQDFVRQLDDEYEKDLEGKLFYGWEDDMDALEVLYDEDE